MSQVIRIQNTSAIVVAWAVFALLSLIWIWLAVLLFVLLGAFGAETTGDLILVTTIFVVDPIALTVLGASLLRRQLPSLAVALFVLAMALTIGAVVY